MADRNTTTQSANDVFLRIPEATGFRLCKTKSGSMVGIELFRKGGNAVVVLPRDMVGDLIAGLVVAIDGTVESHDALSGSATYAMPSPPVAPA